MRKKAEDSFNELSYFSLFDIAEKARWKMTEIDWEAFDKTKCSPELIRIVKIMTIGECTTFSATRSFMDLFAEDLDFTQWLAVWFYEETKHPHALLRWLAMAGEKISEQELFEARSITPMTPSRVEMLTFNIVSEIVAANLYHGFIHNLDEPVIKEIVTKLGKDELRHSVGFEHYCKEYINSSDDPDKERLMCLRSTWAFLQDDTFVQHPVYITLTRMKDVMGDDVIKKIRTQITSRISKAIGVPIDSPEEFYDVYTAFKKSYRQSQQKRDEISETGFAPQ